jgi:N-methylhydantoinase A
VPRVLVPFGAGALSAYGLLAAPLAFDFVRTAPQRMAAADWAQINRLFEEMETEGRRIVRGAGVADRDVTVRRAAEMRYLGQGHEVDVEIPAGPLGPGSLEAITASFETAYRLLYSRTPQGVPLEALNWRAVVSGPRPDLMITGGMASGSAAAPAPKKQRAAYFPETRGYVETPVYDRYGLGPGVRLAGPAIVEEREATTVIGPGAVITVDAHRTLIAEPSATEAR